MSDEENMKFDRWKYSPALKLYTGDVPGEEVDSLPPGVYKLGTDYYDRPTAQIIDRKKERLCDFEHGALPLVMSEIRKFWHAGGLYDKLGMTHKRGILLYGPPGCGKTSIAMAAVEEVAREGGIAVVTKPNELQQAMSGFRMIQPNTKVVVLLEDLDHYMPRQETMMLEMLDGVSTVGGNALYLYTTNNLSEIPERLRCRPSRIDTLIEVSTPVLEHRLEYAKHAANGLLDDQIAWEIAEATDGLSMADITEVVLSVVVYEKTVAETINRLRGSKALVAAGCDDDDEDDDD